LGKGAKRLKWFFCDSYVTQAPALCRLLPLNFGGRAGDLRQIPHNFAGKRIELN
jgi:hypothetical protein